MRLTCLLLLIAAVGALARTQAQSNAAIEAVCLAFQTAQNSLNGTAAGNLFTKDGLMEVPAGSPPNVGPVRFRMLLSHPIIAL